MSASRSAGNRWLTTASRISLPIRASSCTSSVSSPARLAVIFSDSPVSPMKRRYASAVVANPSGTRTPRLARLDTISPSEEFFPPTCSRSASPSSENQRTLLDIRAPSLGALEKLEDDGGHLLDRLGRGVDHRDAGGCGTGSRRGAVR